MLVKNSPSWLIVTYFANERGMACSHHIDDRPAYYVRRPILGLVHKNRELEQILTTQGHLAVAAADPLSVKQGILTCYERWNNDKVLQMTTESPYTVTAAVDALADISKSIRRG